MKKGRLRQFYNNFGVFIILIVEIAIFSIGSDRFLSVDNFLIIGRQVSMIGIASIGMTGVMLFGGIDISVGSILALSGVLSVKLIMESHMNMWLAILIVLAFGFIVGTVIGALWTMFNIPPLISSLAFQTLLMGVAYVMTGGIAVPLKNDTFRNIGQGHLFGIVPIPLVILIVLVLLGYWVLEKTYLGRHIYAVGGNREAAHLSGIRVNRVIILVFAVSGLLAAIAGVINGARMNSGNPAVGTDFAMSVITAVVLGGVNVNGGEGRFINVVAGVFIMGMLGNGLVMLGVNEYYQWIIKGLVLVTAVVASNLKNSSLMMNRAVKMLK